MAIALGHASMPAPLRDTVHVMSFSASDGRVLGVVAAAAGGVEQLRTGLVEPAIEAGWRVAVTLTPTAARWLDHYGERARLERLTGLPVRSEPRLPTEPKPHPPADCYVVAPASANTVAKLALGLADNQALTHACEAVGLGVPMVVFPRMSTAYVGHPAWAGHLAALRRVGVEVIYGEDVWPLYPPGEEPDRPLPWDLILAAADRLAPGG